MKDLIIIVFLIVFVSFTMWGADSIAAQKEEKIGKGIIIADYDNIGSTISADGTTKKLNINDVNKIVLPQQDIAATCETNEFRIDTGGTITEFCICITTDTWKCAALTTGPTD